MATLQTRRSLTIRFIYAVGRLEFAELFTNQDKAVRKHLIEAKSSWPISPS